MSHKPYIMKIEEMQTLIASLISNGPEETAVRMKAKAFMAMDKKDDIDEMFLDMSETFLQRGRDELEVHCENSKDSEPSLANIYYTLAFMLRRLAHETYRKYIKKGQQRDSNRFIKLISYNEKAPLLMI